MYRVRGTIELLAPILFNRPTPKDIKGSDEGSAGGRKTKKEKVDEALDRLHRESDGGIVITREAFKNALVQGAGLANLKAGKRGLAQYLKATVFVEAPLLFGTETPDEIHEHWGRIPPKTGALVLLRRPMMKAGRQLDFVLVVFDDARQPDQIRQAMEAAGMLVGLGAWRPEYGRFLVRAWRVEKGDT